MSWDEEVSQPSLSCCISYVDEAGADAVVALAVMGKSLTCASQRKTGTGGKEQTGRAT